MVPRLSHFLFLAALLCGMLTASRVPAADLPQMSVHSLLPAESVLYVRFGGLDSHQKSLEATTFGQLWQGELHPMVDDISQLILDALGPQALSERLLAGGTPDELLALQKDIERLPKFLEYFKLRGVAVSVEVLDRSPPGYQVTFVFPDGGRDEYRASIFSAFRLLALASEAEIREEQLEGRTIVRMAPSDSSPLPLLPMACWQEAGHVILSLGNEDLNRVIELAEGQRRSLATSPRFEQLSAFDRYETFSNGFIDLDRIFQIAQNVFPPLATGLKDLGLNELKNIRFHVGCQNQYLRTTIVLDTPGERGGERRGVLQLLSSASGSVQPDGLPPLPPDANLVSVSRFDVGAAYQTTVEAINTVVSITSPDDAPAFQQSLDTFEKGLGINLATDLFAVLDSTVVAYSSPAEGPFGLGTTLAIKVNDEAKLADSLETMIQSLTASTGVDLELRRSGYRDGKLNRVVIGVPGFAFSPTYTIHNGWFVVSLYPQPAKGFVYRSDSPARAWIFPESAKEAIRSATARRPNARVTTLEVSDPRPAVSETLSLAPLVVQAITSSVGTDDSFDITSIPAAQAVTERMEHNITVVIDDADSIAIESYWSVPWPAQLTGMHIYALSFSFLFF